MIDSNLVDSAAAQIKQSLTNRQSVGVGWSYALNNILPQPLLDKIKSEFAINEEWTTVHYQENSGRRQIPWKPESVIEETHMAFEACNELVGDIFKENVKLTSVNFWSDPAGYTIPPHTDNNRVGIAIQLYIGDADQQASGTELFANPTTQITKFPWIDNSGYILHNIPESLHGLTSLGPQRTSIYVIYR
jgi:hypothetical protein